jgi:nucleoside triphosphate diphosphatase
MKNETPLKRHAHEGEAEETLLERFAGFDGLGQLVETLRGENGCPWDRKQTPDSIARYLLEEVYELAEAIADGNPEHVCEELGDVLFHISFLAHIYRERHQFDIEAVINTTTAKMVRRHPHVFGTAKVHGDKEIRTQWQEIKRREKPDQSRTSILDSIPGGLPALMRAYRVSERAAGAGFDWADMAGVMRKVEEEWGELKAELSESSNGPDNKRNRALEFGDVLFTLTNVARFAGFHPEEALADSTRKFEKRYRLMEQFISESGKKLADLPAEDREKYWEQAKAAVDH